MTGFCEHGVCCKSPCAGECRGCNTSGARVNHGNSVSCGAAFDCSPYAAGTSVLSGELQCRRYFGSAFGRCSGNGGCNEATDSVDCVGRGR